MIGFWKWVRNNINRFMFLIPIILVAGISISHVVAWYELTNPIMWAIYLSIAIEVGAMTALVAATNRIKGGVWGMFILVTFIQMIGNIFYSYKEIDENGELFKSWVELTLPIWESIGTDPDDVVGLKRWLAFLGGGLLPIISLTSLHFFVKYQDSQDKLDNTDTEPNIVEDKKIIEDDFSEWDDLDEDEQVGKLSVEEIEKMEKTRDDILEKSTLYKSLDKMGDPKIREKYENLPIIEAEDDEFEPYEPYREVETIVEVPDEVISKVEKIVEVPDTPKPNILSYSKE